MFYFASQEKGLKGMVRFFAHHKKGKVLFCNNPVIALLEGGFYLPGHCRWKPFIVNEKNVPVYTEYYPDALADSYRGNSICLYQCKHLKKPEKYTNINSGYVSEQPVIITDCIEIKDLYQELKKYIEKDQLVLHKYEDLSVQDKEACTKAILQEIQNHHLLQNPQASFSLFIQNKMPQIWKKAQANLIY